MGINFALMLDTEASKHVGISHNLDIKIRNDCRQLHNLWAKGNMAQLNLLYDVTHLDWWMHDII